ncbi:MAG: hypothetical protein JSS56_08160, partial [Proteobacteria bacterium]|nr:hypothetical protein [Pseudomonadota bacterium]
MAAIPKAPRAPRAPKAPKTRRPQSAHRKRKGRGESLAGHLTRTLVIWVGGAWLLSVIGVVWYVDREINNNFDTELAEISHRLFDFAARDLDRENQARAAQAQPLVATDPLFSEDLVLFEVKDATGRILMHTAANDHKVFEVPLKPGFVN